MIRSFGRKVPKIAESAWVSEAAYVVGAVEIGEGSSVWPCAVIRADFVSIQIGSNTHIEDNCVLHSGVPMVIGDRVTAGHGVIIHCRSIGNNCLIGNNATLLDGVEIGEYSIVGAGALVLAGTQVPPRSFVVGSPATITEATPEQLRRLEQQGGDDGPYAQLLRRYKERGL
jgi:carbonic anhydrase/acetyltransferase-like protein (isoleucine patch superfamily)